MIDFTASGGGGLTGQQQHQPKFYIFKMGTLCDAIFLAGEKLLWNVDENYKNLHSVQSKIEKNW